MTKHMFAGVSASGGFINFFDDILPLSSAKQRFFLKGSSGSGKSTFIKKIATKFETAGFDCERFHCANDIESLDALAVPGKGLSIIDATAPHSLDPEIPIAIDKIIDFSQFIDESKIKPYMEELKSLQRSKKLLNKKASNYLAAVGNIYQANTLTKPIPNKALVNETLQIWLKFLDAYAINGIYGQNRRLFLSALTPDGYVNFTDYYFKNCKIYGLCADMQENSAFLAKLRDESNARGIDTISFHCPFATGSLEHLYLPAAAVAFVTADKRFGYNGPVDETIDFVYSTNSKILSKEAGDNCYERDNFLFDEMISAAVKSMNESRALHRRIEKIYEKTLDFKRVDKMTEKVIEELLGAV